MGHFVGWHVAPEFAARPVGSISPADARRFRAELVERGLARGTIKHGFDVFRRVLDVAVQDGAIAANPAASVPSPAATRPATRTLPATPDYSIAADAAVYATAIFMVGLVLVMAVAVWKTNSEHRAEVIRAVGDLVRAVGEVIRWIWRGGPPGAV